MTTSNGNKKVTRNRATDVHGRRFDHTSLVGSYFHTTVELGWQGVIVAEPSPGIYLCMLFEWLAGEGTEQKLVRLADMMDWRFYDDAEWMKDRYDTWVHRQWEYEREHPEPDAAK